MPRLVETTAHALRPWRPAVAGIVVVLAGVVAQVLRLPDSVALNTVWAEDGTVFLAQALSMGSARAIVVPYDGYLHLLPRLLAVVASAVSLRDAAFVFGAGSALVVSLLALFVYATSRDLIPNRAVRAALMATVMLVPVAGLELEANAANLHWYLDFAALWALLWLPRSLSARWLSAFVTFLAAASDPRRAHGRGSTVAGSQP